MANARKVVTNKDEGIRLGYVHLTEPYAASQEQDPKYSCMLIIPKTAKRTLAAIKAAQAKYAPCGIPERNRPTSMVS